MINPAVETLNEGKANTQDNGETVLEKSAAALGGNGRSMFAGFQELTEAYQQIAQKNSARLTESIKDLGTVKSPTDLVELQQKLLKETFENAFADSKQIAGITLSAFTKAFEPMQKNLMAAQQAMPQSTHFKH